MLSLAKLFEAESPNMNNTKDNTNINNTHINNNADNT